MHQSLRKQIETEFYGVVDCSDTSLSSIVRPIIERTATGLVPTAVLVTNEEREATLTVLIAR